MTKNIKIVLYILLFLWAPWYNSYGQGTTGGILLKTETGNFLNGNEFFSSTGYGAVFNIYKSPAALSELSGFNGAIHYRNMGWDITNMNLMTSQSIGDKFSIAGGMESLIIPDITRKEEFGGIYFETGIIKTGSFNIPLIVAYKLNDYLALGLKTQYYHETLDNYQEDNFNFGGGIKISNLWENRITLALSALNFGPKLNFAGTDTDLPSGYYGEIKYLPATLSLGMVVTGEKYKDESPIWAFGIEYQYQNKFFVRSAYKVAESESKGILAGIGFRAEKFYISYDYEAMDLFNDIHKISFYTGLNFRTTHPPHTVETLKPVYILSEPQTAPPDTPVAPSNLSYGFTGNLLTVRWEYDMQAFPETTFKVYASLTGKDYWSKLPLKNPSATEISFTPTQKGITIYFKVVALRNGEKSKESPLLKVDIK